MTHSLAKRSSSGLPTPKDLASLARPLSLPQAKTNEAKLAGLQTLARKAGAGLEFLNQISEARLWNLRRAGEMLAEYGGRGGSKTRNGFLKELGIDDNASSRWQALARLSEEKWKSEIESIKAAAEEELTVSAMLRLAKVKNISSSESNEWYTPAEYIEAARRAMGSIDLDPASSEEANETVKAAAFYSTEDNGLEADWRGNVWLNPPYGDVGPLFVQRASDLFKEKAIDQIVVLVNSHCTDAAWFQSLWDGTLCFTKGRINFRKPKSGEVSGSTHGSVFIYFGPHTEEFVGEFRCFGAVVQRIDK